MNFLGRNTARHQSDKSLSAFGHSKRIYTWPVTVAVLAASCWLLLPMSAKRDVADPVYRAQVERMWQFADDSKFRGELDPIQKAYAKSYEQQLIKATGPRVSVAGTNLLNQSNKSFFTKRTLVAINLGVIGLILGWIGFSDRNGRVTVTASQVRIMPPETAQVRTFDRENIAISVRPGNWMRRLLGLGATDVVIRTKDGEQFIIPRVLRSGAFLNAADEHSAKK